MTVEELVERVQGHPCLAMVHRDQTICVIRYSGPDGSREIRLGFWAVRERHWEQVLAALGIPQEASASVA